jgi:predicted DsbA family dithiol-disulfide isomerase
VADSVVVSATVFTDPFCPWSWGAEPQLRRLETEFGAEVDITFVLVGMARQISDGAGLAYEALEAAAASRMPLDPRIFLRDPPSSTHPAGIAVHAVAEQAGGALAGAYLRRLREAILLERRRMDSAPELLDAARDIGGLDVARLRVDFGSSAVLERFGADLERARETAPDAHEPGTGRVAIPSVEFRGEDGEVHGVYGFTPWAGWRAAAIAAGAEPAWDGPPAIEDALRRFEPMATPEISLVCDLAGPRAPAELWRLAQEWRVRFRPVPGGELWSLA